MELILFPFGGNAKEAVFVIDEINKHNPTWNFIGFIDDDPTLRGIGYFGHSVLGGRDKIEDFSKARILACPGRPENFHRRIQIIESLGIRDDRFATLIHPCAQISSGTKIGINTLIMSGVVTTAKASIGNHCIILPNTVISHDVTIEDYSIVGSNVSISGGVHIGRMCYIGTASSIIHEVRIGEGSLIGMAANVVSSIDKNSVVAGNPGKIIRKVQ